MFLFLILAFPGLIAFYCAGNKNAKEYIVPVLWGFFAGSITCVFDTFFVFSSNVFLFSFGVNYLKILLHLEILPLAVTGIIMFLLAKDSIAARLNALFPFWGAFYACYIPYNVLAEKTNFSPFELFAKPLVYAALLILLNAFIKLLMAEFMVEKNIRNMKKINLWILGTILALLIPAAVETLWFIGMQWYFWFAGFVLYETFAVCLYLKTKKI